MTIGECLRRCVLMCEQMGAIPDGFVFEGKPYRVVFSRGKWRAMKPRKRKNR